MDTTPIDAFMSHGPHTIGQDQSIATARKTMHTHGIRHLPVLDGGQLVGIVSQRDMLFVERLRDVDIDQMPVSEAMTSEVYSVPSGTPLRKVVAEMAAQKLGAAVVMRGTNVVGVFTTVDALKALGSLLDSRAPSKQP